MVPDRKDGVTRLVLRVFRLILTPRRLRGTQRAIARCCREDETWRWPLGHMAEAEARVTAFGWLGKCIFMSQGGEEG
jgi:hypothetical protein